MVVLANLIYFLGRDLFFSLFPNQKSAPDFHVGRTLRRRPVGVRRPHLLKKAALWSAARAITQRKMVMAMVSRLSLAKSLVTFCNLRLQGVGSRKLGEISVAHKALLQLFDVNLGQPGAPLPLPTLPAVMIIHPACRRRSNSEPLTSIHHSEASINHHDGGKIPSIPKNWLVMSKPTMMHYY